MNRNHLSSVGKPARTLTPTRPLGPLRILVVDDDIHIRRLNKSALSNFGYQVDAAEDGADAWATLQSANYDLLVTDHNMPKVSGFELLKKVRNARMNLPVIMVSGTMPAAELQRHSSLKLQGKLEKPYTLAALLGTVNDVLCAADAERDPIALAPNPTLAGERSDPPRPSRWSPPRRILLVDDHVELRQLNAFALENSGFDVTLVEDRAAAWTALDAECYDLLITDHTLPNLTGIDFLNELHVARKSLPAILVTELQHQTELHRYPWLQLAATLLKPHAAADLLKIVKRVLRPKEEIENTNLAGTTATGMTESSFTSVLELMRGAGGQNVSAPRLPEPPAAEGSRR